MKKDLRINPPQIHRMKISDDQVRELWSQGYNDCQTAKELKVNKSTAHERRVRLGLKPNDPRGRTHVAPEDALET